MSEIEEVLNRLHVGIHSGDGINRLHWISFIDFIIHNPKDQKKTFINKLVSVMCIRERTVLEYVNCAIAWDVLRMDSGEISYNKTYRKPKKNQKTLSEKEADAKFERLNALAEKEHQSELSEVKS